MSNNQAIPRIIAVANQKGGVGKTTSAINIAAGFAEHDYRVLVVDLDPQGNASTGFGIDSGNREQNIANVLFDDADIAEQTVATSAKAVDILASSADLASADMELKDVSGRSRLLRKALNRDVLSGLGYNFVIIDCPPTLGLLTVNALVASDTVLVPLQAEFFALEGLSQLMQTIRAVREGGNAKLKIEGVLLTMVDKRNNLSAQVESEVREVMGELVFDTLIPRNVRVSEAPSYAVDVLQYDSASRGAVAYRALVSEILENIAESEMA